MIAKSLDPTEQADLPMSGLKLASMIAGVIRVYDWCFPWFCFNQERRANRDENGGYEL